VGRADGVSWFLGFSVHARDDDGRPVGLALRQRACKTVEFAA
jgi:hypothetical protein